MSDFILGLVSLVILVFLNNFGLLFQKHDTDKAKLSKDASVGLYFKRPLWLLGILMQTIMVLPFFFLTIDLLGITLAQPLVTTGLLVFIAGSVYLLKERLRRVEWVGVTFMFSAALMVALSNVTGDVPVSVFLDPGFVPRMLVFFSIATVLIVLGMALTRGRENRRVLGYATLMGVAYALVSTSGQFMTSSFDVLAGSGFETLGWVLLVGGFSATVIGTFAGIVFSQKAFQRSQAITVVPISQAIINVLPVFGGIYVFGQIIQHLPLFFIGIAILLVSVSLLSRFQVQ